MPLRTAILHAALLPCHEAVPSHMCCLPDNLEACINLRRWGCAKHFPPHWPAIALHEQGTGTQSTAGCRLRLQPCCKWLGRGWNLLATGWRLLQCRPTAPKMLSRPPPLLRLFRYKGARTPMNEAERVQTLRQMGILDTAPEKKYEEVTSLLQELFEVHPGPTQ